jgi:hypothetical protein
MYLKITKWCISGKGIDRIYSKWIGERYGFDRIASPFLRK